MMMNYRYSRRALHMLGGSRSSSEVLAQTIPFSKAPSVVRFGIKNDLQKCLTQVRFAGYVTQKSIRFLLSRTFGQAGAIGR